MRWSIRHCVRLFLFSNISHYRLLKIFSPGFKSHQSRLTAAEEQTTNSLLTLKCQLLTCCCRCTQAAFPSLPRCANHLTSHRRENTHTQTLDGTLTQVTYLPTHWAYISRWYTEGQTDRQWKIERWFWQTDRETILYLSIRMKFFKRRTRYKWTGSCKMSFFSAGFVFLLLIIFWCDGSVTPSRFF